MQLLFFGRIGAERSAEYGKHTFYDQACCHTVRDFCARNWSLGGVYHFFDYQGIAQIYKFPGNP
ncbi:hypothetical protein [uncultured Gemmiger sp.]|uniref:hypothetical protein n=1 Tax=uncultured Gemmiger sp. TaxID=1623490 RepID=UPI0026654D6D|nr:hypothetical protein [uncultured Gemmiger sp.]